MPISAHKLEQALSRVPKIAAAVKRIMLDPSYRGVISAAEAAELEQQSGMNPWQLAYSLVPAAQLYAVTPISNYNVGAVAVGLTGALYYGANLEVAGQALSFTLHAEQSATSNAWINGEQGLNYLAISAAPCGYCRQFLYELVDAATLQIVLPDASGNPQPELLTDYLPDAFGPADLGIQGGLMQPQINGVTVAGTLDPTAMAALDAANAAYCPYTKSFAGVALLTANGTICVGQYAENAAYNPAMSPLEAALSQVAFTGQTWASITEAALVQAPGLADQTGATLTLLGSVTNVPLSVYPGTVG